MSYQSLYRRYRPKTFTEIKGQDYIVKALRQAVAENRVGHAYLFHGPRGTGKTSTARVLAKALNCDNLDDGDPCAVCESCVSIERGRSFDLHELDAASNNKVDDIRALLETVKLGSPGRSKVYLLDEAHMLTAGAENALLKTLEEPPGHVTWIMATTEPHKMADTIRSRCQVFGLALMPAEEMAVHARWVADDAGIDVSDDVIAQVVAQGGGSARDTLSALDRVAAAGGVGEAEDSADAILDAIAARDPGAALAAADAFLSKGADPRRVGELAVAGLRGAFLVSMGTEPDWMTAPGREQARRLSRSMTPKAITSALEGLGRSLAEMRQSPNTRVDLEVALVRVAMPDNAPDGEISDRVARIEATLAVVCEKLGIAAGTVQTGRPAAGGGGTAEQSAQTGGGATAAEKQAPGPSVAAGGQAPGAGDGASRTPDAAAPAAAEAEPETKTETETEPKTEPETEPEAESVADLLVLPSAEDRLRSLRPSTPTEVVELAELHLGMDKEATVAFSKTVLDPAEKRNEKSLTRLWLELLNNAGKNPPGAGPGNGGQTDPHTTPEGGRLSETSKAAMAQVPDEHRELLRVVVQAFPGVHELAALGDSG